MQNRAVAVSFAEDRRNLSLEDKDKCWKAISVVGHLAIWQRAWCARFVLHCI